MLQEGIKIAAPEEIYNSLEISTGLTNAKGYSSVGIPYMNNAIKPIDEWRQLNDEELALLKAPSNENPACSTVYVFTLPDILKNKFEEITLNNVISKRHFMKIQREKNDAFKTYASLLNKYSAHFLEEGKEITKTYFSVNDGNLATTTKYFLGKQYTGLHIDNIDKFTIDNAQHAQNRLVINLGSQKRYFLFVNQPLSEMKNWILKKRGEFNSKNTQWHLSQLFFRTYGTYPIVRIPLAPFQAYIAPTENCLHDGSTLGSTAPDITYTLFGHFSL